MAVNQAERLNANIDSDYLEAGRAAALEARLDEKGHPMSAGDIWELVKRQYRFCEMHLSRHYARITESYLWFCGQHQYRIDDASRRFVRIESTKKIPRPTINLVFEKVESIAGDLNKGVIAGHIVPNSMSILDRLGARAGEKIRAFKWDLDEMDEVQTAIIQGATIAGDMFTLTELDTDYSELVEIEGPDGQPMKVSLADVVTRPILPLQIFFNPGATSLKTARFQHIHVNQPADFFRAQFPHVGDEFSPDAASQPVATWQWKLHEILTNETNIGAYGTTGYNASEEIEKQVVVHQVFFPPDRFYPQGRLFIAAGGAVGYAGPLKKPHKILTTHYRYSPVENSIWSQGLVQPMIPLVKHIESAAAQNTLTRKAASMPMVWAPLRSGGSFKEGELRAEPMGIYTFRPDPVTKAEPRIVQGAHPADAGYVADMQLWLQEFIERVTGAKQVLAGERPQGVSAGIAIRQLIQRASVRFAPKLTAALKHNERMESHRLQALAVSPAWVYPRLINSPGKAGRRSIGYFRAADMRDNFSYRIEAGPKDLQDEMTTSQLSIDMAGIGMLDLDHPNPVIGARNRMTFLKNVGLGEAGYVTEGSRDVERGEYLLGQIIDGEEVSYSPFDDFAVMFAVAVDFMKTEEYMDLQPDIMEAVLAHTFECKARLEMLQAGMMMGEQLRAEQQAQIAGPMGMLGEMGPGAGPGGPGEQGPGGPPARQGGGPPPRGAKRDQARGQLTA